MSFDGPTAGAVPSTEVASFLSPAEYSSRSGLSLSTVSRYLAAGLLPKVQPGGPRCRVLIPIEALNSLSLQATGRDTAPTVVRDNLGGEQATSSEPKTSRSPQRGPAPRWKGRRSKVRSDYAETPKK